MRKWIKEKMVVASSQDLGQDYEHLEMLMAKYDSIKKEVNASKDKLDNCINLSQRLKTADENILQEVASNRDACVSGTYICCMINYVMFHSKFQGKILNI